MRTFHDINRRSWQLELTVGRLKKVRHLTGIDLSPLAGLMKPGQDGEAAAAAFGQIMGNCIDFVDALFVLCEEQAEKLKVSDEEFGAAIDASALEQAQVAFIGALADFLPEPERSKLAELLERNRKEMGKFREALEATPLEKLLTSAPNTPESSESTPTP